MGGILPDSGVSPPPLVKAKAGILNNLATNIGHIAIAIVVIIAVTILAWHGSITGGSALAIIAGIGGVSLGGAVATSSTAAGVAAVTQATTPPVLP